MMQKRITSSIFIFLFLMSCAQQIFAQENSRQSIKHEIQKANNVLQKQFKNHPGGKNNPSNNLSVVTSGEMHILEIRKKINGWISSTRSVDSLYLGDTLVVGFTPGEVLVIDSVWMHPGPIIVMGDGVLKFQHAQATILGDIYTVQNAKVIADSSYLYFPQEYFYQRGIILTGNSKMEVRYSTMDFGGLVHSMATVQSATLLLDHVKKPDFSTIGMYNQSTIIMDSVNIAGEFIITDSVHLNIQKAGTVLLWHQFGKAAQADISFPDGENVESYHFNNSVPGVSGVNYDIQITDCKNVMWGLMPSNGSDVTISNSKLRTVGFWFEGGDSSDVSGLVGNNHYDDFTAGLDDRFFHLNNSDVMTWSLYTYDSTVVNVKGSILGEVGSMGQSVVTINNSFVDGSGGYLWSTDTTFMVNGFMSLSSSLRSSGNSFLIFAYSTMMNGQVQALQNSVLMLIQSSTTEAPAFDPGSVVWMAKIASPASGFVNGDVKIRGSAWIDKGYASTWMDFDHYTMSYQRADDTTTWYLIGSPNQTEVRDDVLAGWNTQGLAPGAYFLKLELTDNWGNTMTALKTFTLLPAVLGTGEEPERQDRPKIFPNPFTDKISVVVSGQNNDPVNFVIYDSRGMVVFSKTVRTASSGEMNFSIDGSGFIPEIYFYRMEKGGKAFTGKLVKF